MGLVPMRRGSFDGGVICTTNGWLKEQDQQFLYNGLRVLEKNAGPSAFQLQKNSVEK